MRSSLADLGLLLIGILWGLGFVFVKIGLNSGMNPYIMLSIRFLFSFIILYAILNKKISKFSLKELKIGVIIGICQYMGYLLQTLGTDKTTASNTAIFTALNVIIVPYIFWILNRHRPDFYAFLSSIMCLLGVFIMSFDAKITWNNIIKLTNLNIGDKMVIGSAFFFALQIAFTGYYSKRIQPFKLTLLQLLLPGILFTFDVFHKIGLVTAINQLKTLSFIGIVAIIYLIIFSTSIPLFLQPVCQKYTTSTKASILLSTESIFAMLFAYLIIHEHLTKQVLLGAIFIFLAVLISETKHFFIRK